MSNLPWSSFIFVSHPMKALQSLFGNFFISFAKFEYQLEEVFLCSLKVFDQFFEQLSIISITEFLPSVQFV